jgi:hypothetical protein
MTTDPEDGLLFGLKSIAAHLGLTPRQAERLVHRQHLPTFRLGARICSTKRALAEHFSALIRSTKGE